MRLAHQPARRGAEAAESDPASAGAGTRPCAVVSAVTGAGAAGAGADGAAPPNTKGAGSRTVERRRDGSLAGGGSAAAAAGGEGAGAGRTGCTTAGAMSVSTGAATGGAA